MVLRLLLLQPVVQAVTPTIGLPATQQAMALLVLQV